MRKYQNVIERILNVSVRKLGKNLSQFMLEHSVHCS